MAFSPLVTGLLATFMTGIHLAPGPAVTAPRGAAVVIDGRVGDLEWQGAAVSRLPDGSTLRAKHDDAYLYLGLTAAQEGFPSVCIATGETVRILHASAALGAVTYRRSGGGWTPSEAKFDYGMRTPDLTDAARSERSDYLAKHGWVGSTFRMGNGRAQELQISLDLASRRPVIALGYYAMKGNDGSVVAWPPEIAAVDGCADLQLVRGSVPPRLHFDPAAWATITLAP